MRHLGSIVLSLLLAPIVYALAGIGLVKVSDVPSRLSTSDYAAVSIGLAALLGAGLAYALLVMARLSPLGPVLAGLGYLAVTGWFIGSRSSFTRVVHADAPWVRGAALAPAGAVTALLAVPLLATLVSPRRWRRWANSPAAVATSGYPPPAAPAYPPPYPAPTSAPPDQTESTEATIVLPSSGPPAQTTAAPRASTYGTPAAPSAWPVRGDPVDPETTRKLP
jgi:hypothetical protein